MRIVETDRLSLRHFTLEDAGFLLKLMNDPAWIRFVGSHEVSNLERARRHLAAKYIDSYERLGFGLYLVERKRDGLPLGMCGLIRRDGLGDVDLGFAFLPEHRNRGYAVESAAGVMAHARRQLGLGRLVAITEDENLPSIRVLEKLGFVMESRVTLPGDDQPLRLYAHEFRTPLE